MTSEEPQSVHEDAYTESQVQHTKRVMAFSYHQPKGAQVVRYQVIRARTLALAKLFNTSCPPGRELSLAMTKLEESVMWANAAIARNE